MRRCILRQIRANHTQAKIDQFLGSTAPKPTVNLQPWFESSPQSSLKDVLAPYQLDPIDTRLQRAEDINEVSSRFATLFETFKSMGLDFTHYETPASEDHLDESESERKEMLVDPLERLKAIGKALNDDKLDSRTLLNRLRSLYLHPEKLSLPKDAPKAYHTALGALEKYPDIISIAQEEEEERVKDMGEVQFENLLRLDPKEKEMMSRVNILSPSLEDLHNEFVPPTPTPLRQLHASATPSMHQLSYDELVQILPEGIAGERQQVDQPTLKAGPWLPGENRFLLYRDSMGKLVERLQSQLDHSFVGPDGEAVKGMLLSGRAGSGKSAVLTTAACWARLQGWLVLHLPHASDVLVDKRISPSKTFPGKYDQPIAAANLARKWLQGCGDLLEVIPIHSLSAPSTTVAKLLASAVDHPQEASAALSRALETIRSQTTFPVLVAVDEYNAYHAPSTFLDPNAKHLKPLSASALVLPSLLEDLKEHRFVFGNVLAAASSRYPALPAARLEGVDVIDNAGMCLEECNMLVEHYLRYYRGVHDQVDNPFTMVGEQHYHYIHHVSGGIPQDVFKYAMVQAADISSPPLSFKS